MNRLGAHTQQLKEQNRKALVTFVTAGDPSLDQLPEILIALEQSGADVIELGMPFSDPIADGSVIQASSFRSLQRGTTTRKILDQLSKVKLSVPVVLMGYSNPIFRYGIREFAMDAAKAGASGVLLTDITAEEAEDWRQTASEYGLDTVFIVAPNSTGDRIEVIAEASTGFLYAVSRTGVTGVHQRSSDSLESFVRHLKLASQVPVYVGFGISNATQAKQIAELSDGIVIGSAIVQMLAKEGSFEQNLGEVSSFVREVRSALDSIQ